MAYMHVFSYSFVKGFGSTTGGVFVLGLTYGLYSLSSYVKNLFFKSSPLLITSSANKDFKKLFDDLSSSTTW